VSDDAFSRTSILYGEAFELGFNCALAGRSYLPKEPLHEFLESSHSSRNAARRRALTYMDICNKVLNSEDPIDAFLDYYSQITTPNFRGTTGPDPLKSRGRNWAQLTK